MATESKEGTAESACPFCSFWASWKKSEAARHVRGIERESLLLMRSMLQSCVEALERPQTPKPEK
jgi:hypothetical protein